MFNSRLLLLLLVLLLLVNRLTRHHQWQLYGPSKGHRARLLHMHAWITDQPLPPATATVSDAMAAPAQ
jgi:hypothetical protein